MPATATTACSLVDRVATLPSGGVTAVLDLDRPLRGITVPAAVGSDHLLGVDLGGGTPPTDHWLRGTDITAVYEPAGPRRLRTTAMWRALPNGGPPAWEVVVSAQTSLPASDAALAVVSEVTAEEILCSSAPSAADGWRRVGADGVGEARALLLRRPAADPGLATSVLVAVHPADARTITVSRRDGRVVVACWLFSAAIEKGVLLRGRVLAAIGPAADDRRWSARLFDAFAGSAAPLTT